MISTTNTSAYQMPLFEQYPLSVEFDRHKEMIERCFAAQPEKYRNRDEAMRLGAELEICPIELRPHDLTIEHEPEYDGKGNIRGYCCTARAGFIGDPELWILYPFELPEPMPEGEIFRQQLIISLHASTTAEGEDRIHRAVAHVRAILGLQTEHIEHFNALLVKHAASLVAPEGEEVTDFGAVVGHPQRLPLES